MSQHGNIVKLKEWLSRQIIGQERLLDRLLIALLADGHLLVEGAPGLAKTKAIKDLSRSVEGDFHRIQFTPDLLPSDITGTEIFRPEDGSFRFQQGPIFHNLVLADEINRAPAKVQSALLEAMAERQVSVGRDSFTLPDLFLVMATQNPIEQEGTYPLPEAQLDRFLMLVKIDYPALEAERDILNLVRNEAAMSKVRRRIKWLKPIYSQPARKCWPCIWRLRWRNTSSSWSWRPGNLSFMETISMPGWNMEPALAARSHWTAVPGRIPGYRAVIL